MKLISMTNYVIHLSENGWLEFEQELVKQGKSGTFIQSEFDTWMNKKIVDYANLLKTSMNVNMFLPDENGSDENVIFQNVEKRSMSFGNPDSFAIDVSGFQVAYYKSLPDYWVGMDKEIEDLCEVNIELKSDWSTILK